MTFRFIIIIIIINRNTIIVTMIFFSIVNFHLCTMYWNVVLPLIIETVFKTEGLFSYNIILKLSHSCFISSYISLSNIKSSFKISLYHFGGSILQVDILWTGKFSGLLGPGLWPFYCAPGTKFAPAKHPNLQTEDFRTFFRIFGQLENSELNIGKYLSFLQKAITETICISKLYEFMNLCSMYIAKLGLVLVGFRNGIWLV